MEPIIQQLATELTIPVNQVQSAVTLIDDGNTVPFIARYRKEVTGGLTDEHLRNLNDRLAYLRNLNQRKEEVVRLITEQDKMTEQLGQQIDIAKTMTEVEDLYRPYKKKRRTRATIAKEKGLEPLANLILLQMTADKAIKAKAGDFIDPEKGVESVDDAINGAKDIVAEAISDDADLRKNLRTIARNRGKIISKALVEDSTVYDLYYDHAEPVSQIVAHRVLAINRGEKEKILSVKLDLDENLAINKIQQVILNSTGHIYLEKAIEDAYKRLIFASIEREIRNELTELGEEQAIKIFSENLRSLLLQPPVKEKIVMGLDPAYRTGNKVAVVDGTGKVLDTSIVYMTLEHHNVSEAKAKLKAMIKKYNVSLIAIGNGTASKETEIVTAEMIGELDQTVHYVVVNEAGASVYSASKLATEEFPNFDVAQRSAVSIARRLQDPLAELVKIDPKAIGVGQYQHDVNQRRLADTLDGVVEYCVNEVGVDLNTASPSLLKNISGISAAIANNIVTTREENGPFASRAQLKKVPKLGPKAFEQCAGFLRIPGGKNVLDNTAIHPESYDAVKRLADRQGFNLNNIAVLEDIRHSMDAWDVNVLADEVDLGVLTLQDIIKELKKPGRDPREAFEQPILRSDVMHLEDLKPDMVLTGTVRNVVDFGAFVDIGVHQDGLVHISQLANQFVKHPMDVVKVGDVVTVKVLTIDAGKKRISLTMKDID
jgi:uncharacterized protein